MDARSHVASARIKAFRVEGLGGDSNVLLTEELEAHPKLKEALARADEEYTRALSRYPRKYCKLFLEPGFVKVDGGAAEAVARLLRLKVYAPGRYGPWPVGFNGRRYKVWVDLWFCG